MRVYDNIYHQLEDAWRKRGTWSFNPELSKEIVYRLPNPFFLTMFRSPRISSCIAGPSCSTSTSVFSRAYAVSVQSPRIWPGKEEPRRFDERKTYLYNQFTNLISRGSSQPLLFLQHKNFRAQGMVKLRREVTASALPKKTSLSMLANPPPQDELPQLSVIRTSIFGVALREYATLDRPTVEAIARTAGSGGLALLSLPSLDPPKLTSVLRALERAVPKPKKAEDASQTKGKGKGADDEGITPGRKMKRQRPLLDPELVLLGALIEGRVFGVEGVKDVAKLPTLETLHAQIVGLLSSPAVQLAMVLGEASGGRLARTLEALKKGLEGESSNTEQPSSS